MLNRWQLSSFLLLSFSVLLVNAGNILPDANAKRRVVMPQYQAGIEKEGVSRSYGSPKAKTWAKVSSHYLVPYVISSTMSGATVENIRWSMNYIERGTNIKFVKREAERDYISIIDEKNGCWTYMGKIGGEQEFSIDSELCSHVSVILHLLMHVLGVGEEHRRYDRDNYVNVFIENVLDDYLEEMQVFGPGEITHKYADYDLASITHYGTTAYAQQGKESMTAKDPEYNIVINGERSELSSCDFATLNGLYPGTRPTFKCSPGVIPTGFEHNQACIEKHDAKTCEEMCRYDNAWYFMRDSKNYCVPKGGRDYPDLPIGLTDEESSKPEEKCCGGKRCRRKSKSSRREIHEL